MINEHEVIRLLEDAIANADTDERKNAHTLRTLNRDLAEVVSGIQDGTHVISKRLLEKATRENPKDDDDLFVDWIDQKLTLANAACWMWDEE